MLRIDTKQKNTIKKEYVFLKETNGAFGPKILANDFSKKIIPHNYIIQEFIRGTEPILNKKIIKNIVVFFNKLHSKKYSKIPKNMREYSVLNLFNKRYAKVKKHANSRRLSKLNLEKFVLFLRDKDYMFKKLKNFPFVHGDPNKNNILVSGNNIKMIDWEFTEINVPEWDLAGFVLNNSLSKEKESYFLKEYYKNINKNKLLKYNIIKIIYALGVLLWALEREIQIRNKKVSKSQKRSTIKDMHKTQNALSKRIMHEINSLL